MRGSRAKKLRKKVINISENNENVKKNLKFYIRKAKGIYEYCKSNGIDPNRRVSM